MLMREVVDNMRARAEQCRRLSDLITNNEVRNRLRAMADEIDADLKRLVKKETGRRKKD